MTDQAQWITVKTVNPLHWDLDGALDGYAILEQRDWVHQEGGYWTADMLVSAYPPS